MLEQEIASIIKWMLDNSGNPNPYYYAIPQSFAVPAAFFPVPEIETGGETLSSYNMDYTMFVKFFARTREEAYRLGLLATTATRTARNLVPLIKEDGEKAGSGIRIRDPELKVLDDGAAQMTVSWRSRRPYVTEDSEKMMVIDLSLHGKPYKEKTIDEAMESAISRYVLD